MDFWACLLWDLQLQVSFQRSAPYLHGRGLCGASKPCLLHGGVSQFAVGIPQQQITMWFLLWQ